MNYSADKNEVLVATSLGLVPQWALLAAARTIVDEYSRKSRADVAALQAAIADLANHFDSQSDAYNRASVLDMLVMIAQVQVNNERAWMSKLDQIQRVYCGGYRDEVWEHSIASRALEMVPPVVSQ